MKRMSSLHDSNGRNVCYENVIDMKMMQKLQMFLWFCVRRELKMSVLLTHDQTSKPSHDSLCAADLWRTRFSICSWRVSVIMSVSWGTTCCCCCLWSPRSPALLWSWVFIIIILITLPLQLSACVCVFQESGFLKHLTPFLTFPERKFEWFNQRSWQLREHFSPTRVSQWRATILWWETSSCPSTRRTLRWRSSCWTSWWCCREISPRCRWDDVNTRDTHSPSSLKPSSYVEHKKGVWDKKYISVCPR